MRVLDWLRERRDAKFAEQWDREHRWDDLGRYNAERSRGLVHTPEWQARMKDEQRAFNLEQGRSTGFPYTLEPHQ